MPRPAPTVAAYLASLPADLRHEVALVRDAINRRLPSGYEEGIQYGMIGWYVPHAIFPRGYHCDPSKPLPFAALAGRKHGLSVAFMGMHAAGAEWQRFLKAWAAAGERVDAGVCCVRFRQATPAALRLLGDVVARTPVKRYVEQYVSMLREAGRWKDRDGEPPSRGAARSRRRSTARPRRSARRRSP